MTDLTNNLLVQRILITCRLIIVIVPYWSCCWF